MMLGRRCIVVLLSCVCLAAATGCGDAKVQRASVQGVVTYKGEPAANVMVGFIDDIGVPSMGKTDINGKFEISSVPIGTLTVTVKSLKKEIEEDYEPEPPADALEPEPREANEPKPPDPNESEDDRKLRAEKAQQRETQKAAEKAAEGIKIPGIYNGFKSGLKATVSKNAADNVFQFKLE